MCCYKSKEVSKEPREEHLQQKWMRSFEAMITDLNEKHAKLFREELTCENALRSYAISAKKLRKLSPGTASVVNFNVGGSIHSISQDLLNKHSDSMLYELAYSKETLRDPHGSVLLDRDGETFEQIVNCLRGYTPLFCTNESTLLTEDLEYYRLQTILEKLPKARQKGHVGVPKKTVILGSPRNPYCVGLVGNVPFIQGKHCIAFLVKRCEYLGVGMVSDHCRTLNQEFHKTQHCCVYYMTGVFYSNYSHHVKEEGLERFISGDTMTLTADMEARTILFSKNHRVIRIVSTERATRLRFAVVMKFDSEVVIV